MLKIIKFGVEWASTENWVDVRKLHRSVLWAQNELNEGLKLLIYRKCATQKDVDKNRFWEILSLNLKTEESLYREMLFSTAFLQRVFQKELAFHWSWKFLKLNTKIWNFPIFYSWFWLNLRIEFGVENGHIQCKM